MQVSVMECASPPCVTQTASAGLFIAHQATHTWCSYMQIMFRTKLVWLLLLPQNRAAAYLCSAGCQQASCFHMVSTPACICARRIQWHPCCCGCFRTSAEMAIRCLHWEEPAMCASAHHTACCHIQQLCASKDVVPRHLQTWRHGSRACIVCCSSIEMGRTEGCISTFAACMTLVAVWMVRHSEM